jgi:hypothetical protein
MRYTVNIKREPSYRIITDGQTNRHIVSARTKGSYNIRLVEPQGLITVLGRTSYLNLLNVEDLANVTGTAQDRYMLVFNAKTNKWHIRALTSEDLPPIDGGFY